MASAASRRELLSFMLAGSLGALHVAGCSSAPVLVHLVRHAEKLASAKGAPPDEDPPLSEVGQRRSEKLVSALAGVTLRAVFATQFKRTQQTVAPVAAAHGLQVEALDANDLDGLIARIRAYAGQAVLVAGHSNTVPEIASALRVTEKVALGEADFGDLFVLRSSAAGSSLERRRFEP